MQRWLTIGVACVVAAVILGLSLMTGPVTTPEEELVDGGPVNLPDAFVGGAVSDMGSLPALPTEEGSVFLAEQRTWVRWSSLTPEPDGMFEIDRPRVRVALEGSGVLEIVADEGTFYAPGRDPRNGEFRGSVVVNLYQTPEGKAPRYGETSDVTARAYLDRVRFDLELGLLETEGPLHLTGPLFDYRGVGFELRYNQLRRRVEELRVARSDVLRLNSALLGDEDGGPGAGDGRRAVDGSSGVDDVARDTDENGSVLYGLDVDGPVLAEVRGGEAVVRGERLEALLRVGGGEEGLSLGDPERGLRGSPEGTQEEVTAGTEVGEPDVAGDGSLCPVSENDTLVTWSGAVVLRPSEGIEGLTVPAVGELSGRVMGTPALLTTAEGTATARGIGFDSDGRTVWAQAEDEASPARLATTGSGFVQGDRLSYRLAERRGVFEGPGSWEAPVEGALLGGARDLVWGERLAFTVMPEGAEIRAGAVFGRVAEAEALGSVSGSHDQGYVDAERLALVTLEDGVGAVLAEGGVTTRYLGDGRDEPVLLVSESAEVIVLEGLEGSRTVVERAGAGGGARVSQGVRSLEAESMAAHFATEPGVANRVERITATGEVRATDRARDLEATGQRATVLAERGEVRLVGGDEVVSWATVRQGTSELRGGVITGTQASDALAVDGPGEVRHVIDEGGEVMTAQQPEAVDDGLVPGLQPVRVAAKPVVVPATSLELGWVEGMTFQRSLGLAVARGEVDGVYRRGLDEGRLAADELRIEVGQADAINDQDTLLDEGFDLGSTDVRAVRATGDEQHGAELMWLTRTDSGVDATRTTLSGPAVAYDRETASSEVLGDGWLLYETFGPPVAGQRDGVASGLGGGGGSGVFPLMLQGEGAQRGLLRWKDRMTLDMNDQRAVAEDGVELIYEAGRSPAVYVDATRMEAAFEGLSFFDEQGQTVRLLGVEAYDDVQVVREERVITSDGLRFYAIGRVVELWADPGKLVREAGTVEAAGLSAKRVKWSLDRDEVDILEPSPVVMPVEGRRR
ncbi:MAG: hypothetical protein RLN76_11220 [Phycisphaeraceae bacterium]